MSSARIQGHGDLLQAKKGHYTEEDCDMLLVLFREEMPNDVPPPACSIMLKILTWFRSRAFTAELMLCSIDPAY